MERLFCWGASLVTLSLLSIALTCYADAPAISKTATSKIAPLKKGDSVGAFYVTKVAGANDDGVSVGTELCYRCRYGSRPIVMVFTRNIDGQVPALIEQLDTAVVDHEASQLRGLVTLLGDDVAEVKENATKVAEKSGVKRVPVVVAKEATGGPANYKLNQTADVTVVLASDSQVVSAKTYDSARINVAAIMKDVKTLLK